MQKLISEMDEKLNELQPETKIAGKTLSGGCQKVGISLAMDYSYGARR